MSNPNLIDGCSKYAGLILPIFADGFNVFLDIVSFTRADVPTQTPVMTNTTTSLTDTLCRGPSRQTPLKPTSFTVSNEIDQRVPTEKNQVTDTFCDAEQNTSETLCPCDRFLLTSDHICSSILCLITHPKFL